MEGTVYVVRNKVNSKCYVGQTTKFVHDRLLEHTRKGYLLTAAIQKYGPENFELILVQHTELSNLTELEKNLIKEYKSLLPFGYNILEYGQVGDVKYWEGKSRSEETKLKISQTKKGTNAGENNPFYGKKHNKESLAKISLKKTGVKYSLEVRQNLSRLKMGHSVSEETREKLRQSNKGRKPSALAIQNATKARQLKALQRRKIN